MATATEISRLNEIAAKLNALNKITCCKLDVDPLAFKVPSAKVFKEAEDIFIEEHTIGIEEEDIIKINE